MPFAQLKSINVGFFKHNSLVVWFVAVKLWGLGTRFADPCRFSRDVRRIGVKVRAVSLPNLNMFVLIWKEQT